MSIADLVPLPAGAAPEWMTGVGLPAGWRQGRYVGDNPTEPWSVAVRGERSDGRWDACETITVFSFTGLPVAQDIWQLCESSLKALHADNIVIVEIAAPAVHGVSVISGSGEFRVEDRFIHGQFNYYAAGSPESGRGRLVQQCLYVDAAKRAEFEAAIALMGNELHKAFVESVAGTS
jgi:hypothetical protein